jgi:ankyrin repeat protein
VHNEADVNQANQNGDTPLILSAQNGYFPIVEFLVQNNADVNQAK